MVSLFDAAITFCITKTQRKQTHGHSTVCASSDMKLISGSRQIRFQCVPLLEIGRLVGGEWMRLT